MTAPQQFSPDGQWWWDGTQWVPASQAPQPPAQPAVPQQPPAPAPPGWPSVDPNAPAWPQAPAGAPPYPQQPYGYPTQPLYGAPPPATGNDGKAIGSLVSSLLGIFCGIGLVVGIILGFVSRSEARKQGRQPSGMALAGIIIGFLGVLGYVVVIAVIATNAGGIKNTFDTSLELQSAADAEHSYHAAHGQYTPNVADLAPYDFVNIDNDVQITIVSATDTTFCITGKVFGQSQYVDQNRSRPSSTPCG